MSKLNSSDSKAMKLINGLKQNSFNKQPYLSMVTAVNCKKYMARRMRPLIVQQLNSMEAILQLIKITSIRSL